MMGEAGPVMQMWYIYTTTFASKPHYSGSVSSSNYCISSSFNKINNLEIQTQSTESVTEAQHYKTSLSSPQLCICPRTSPYIH